MRQLQQEHSGLHLGDNTFGFSLMRNRSSQIAAPTCRLLFLELEAGLAGIDSLPCKLNLCPVSGMAAQPDADVMCIGQLFMYQSTPAVKLGHQLVVCIVVPGVSNVH